MHTREEMLAVIEKIVEDLVNAYDHAPTLQNFAPFIPLLRLWLVQLQTIKDEADGDQVS